MVNICALGYVYFEVVMLVGRVWLPLEFVTEEVSDGTHEIDVGL